MRGLRNLICAVMGGIVIGAGLMLFPSCCAAALGDGDLLWGGPQGVPVTDEDNGTEIIHAVSDGNGGSILAYSKGVASGRIKVQRLDSSGNQLWNPISGQEGIYITPSLLDTGEPTIAPDGSGGAVIAWAGQYEGVLKIYAQRIDAMGNTMWPESLVGGVESGGVVASGPRQAFPPGSVEYRPGVSPDGQGGAFVSLYPEIAHISSSGVQTALRTLPASMVTSDGSGGIYGVWHNSSGIFAQRYSQSLIPLWLFAQTVSDNPWLSILLSISGDGSGNLLVSWYGMHYPQSVVRAQKIDGNRNVLWTANGVVVADSLVLGGLASCWDMSTRVHAPALAADGTGGAIIGWRDCRNETDPNDPGLDSESDPYGQRLNASGVPQWQPSGLLLTSNAPGTQYDIVVAGDGKGGGIFAFNDLYGYTYDVSAAHVNAQGTKLWSQWIAYDNFEHSCKDQRFPHVVFDSSGPDPKGAIILWKESCGWHNKPIYANKIYIGPAFGPDLIETSVSNPPASASPGGTFSVTDTVKNQGTSTAGASITQYFLSLDTTLFTDIDIFIGQRSVPSLAVEATSTGTATATLPSNAPSGSYYLLACANQASPIDESSRTNNCKASGTKVQVGAQQLPDLIETHIDNPPAGMVQGQSFMVMHTIKNQGNETAGASTTKAYLSLNSTKNSGDIPVSGQWNVTSLDAEQTYSAQTRLTIPSNAAAGSYYLIACADDLNAVAESKENNNCIASSNKVQVALPPDLKETSVSNPPATAKVGSTFSMTDTVKNQGGGSAEPTQTSYCLSVSTDYTTGHRYEIGYRSVPSLAAGATSTGSATVTVPSDAEPGAYYVLACADSPEEVTETNEQNNCTASGTTVQVTSTDGVTLELPEATGKPGASVKVPVTIGPVTDLQSAEFTVTFDSTVLSAQGAQAGSFAQGFSVAPNTNTPGKIIIAMAGVPVTGSGELALISFTVLGGPGSSTALAFESTSLNDDAIKATPKNGSFTVPEDYYAISGKISYYHNSEPVQGVSLALSGGQNLTQTSKAGGGYAFSQVPAGAWTLTPSKSNGVGTAITAMDASLVLQAAAQMIVLDPQQLIAADANGNGKANAMDASLILQYAVAAISLPFSGANKIWAFDPPKRDYPDLAQDQTDQGFAAILIGDANGSWQEPSSVRQAQSLNGTRATTMSLPDTTGDPGINIQIPVAIGSVVGLQAAQFTITFDPNILSAQDAKAGSFAQGFSMAFNRKTPGKIIIAMAGVPVTGDGGELALISFAVKGPAGSSTALSFRNVFLNDGAIKSALQNGSFAVSDPNPQMYSATGIVETRTGPLPRVTMTLKGAANTTVATRAKGAYQFTGLQNGNYTITPSKTGYTFTPVSRRITVKDKNIIGLKFTGTKKPK